MEQNLGDRHRLGNSLTWWISFWGTASSMRPCLGPADWVLLAARSPRHGDVALASLNGRRVLHPLVGGDG